jgi:hypothetical protein
MIKQISITSALSLLLLSGVAANAATTSSNIDADIVPAIAITNTVSLQFGMIASSASAGTVTVTTAGVRSSTGGVTLANGTPATAASFSVTGADNNTYSITLPVDGTTTITGAGDPMGVNFVSSPSGAGTLSGAGAQTLLVGATLSVGASQAAGAYAGTFDATVDYN